MLYLKIVVMMFFFSVKQFAASTVSFTASNYTITPSLTSNLQINCSIQILDGKHHNLKQIFSISISRGTSEVVASVTAYSPAKALADTSILRVAGDVGLNTSPYSSYLSLTWSNPDHNQAGTYTCNINGLNVDMQGVTLTGNLTVNIRQPSENEVLNFISHLNQRLLAYEEKTKLLELNCKNLETATKNLNNILDNYIEKGSLACGHSDNYISIGNNKKAVSKRVLFKHPHEKPPMIFVSLTDFDLNKDTNTRYWIGAANVTPTGFDLECGTWADTHIYGSGVTWIAIKST